MMYDIKKLMKDVLVRCFDAEQLDQITKDLDPTFDIYEITGISKKFPIPRQMAIDCIFRYLRTEETFIEFVGMIIAQENLSYYGSRVRIPNKQRILRILEARNWIFDERLGRFRRDQSVSQSADWGFMQEGEEYHLSFVSIDIVGNSGIVQNNVKTDVEHTFSSLRSYILRYIEQYDGRIWYWHGDGGLAVFHDYKGVTDSMMSMINILSYLPVFNLCENQLRPEDDIKLRIGVNYGRAMYNSDTSKISSNDIKLAEDLEKNYAIPNSIAATGVIYQFLQNEIRNSLELIEEKPDVKIYRYHVI